MKYKIGQCWSSEPEPELGLGFVRELEGQTVRVAFPAADTERRYGVKSAPLKRIEFKEGDTVVLASGKKLAVARRELGPDGVWTYHSKGEAAAREDELSPQISASGPLDRLIARRFDPLDAYDTRQRALRLRQTRITSPARGFLGARAALLPHQLYVASEICRRSLPRALLADEVGLGKTIEAGWIAHHLITTERARRVLVLAPLALVNQWFVELLRRFNLPFWVPDSETSEPLRPSDLSARDKLLLSHEDLSLPDIASGLARSQWDLLIVDEAHHIRWKPNETASSAPNTADGGRYRVLEDLCLRTPGVLLLTATPEQVEPEAHFSRLRLVDPYRFSSIDDYKAEQPRYREISKLVRAVEGFEGKKLPAALSAQVRELLPDLSQEILPALVDRFGPGRAYFRNTRRTIQTSSHAFPKRVLKTYPLKKAATHLEALSAWFAAFVPTLEGKKALVLVQTDEAASILQESLRLTVSAQTAVFLQSQPLLVRDRQAAFFVEPDGAQILIASEVGGEGRNFQHAQHLILGDLPIDPDLLEQRIGRLDRIGQEAQFTIHVPYREGSPEHRLLRWHNEAFEAFDRPPRGAAKVLAGFKALMEENLQSSAKGSSADFEKLLKQAREAFESFSQELEEGRDALLELNSFDRDQAERFATEMARAQEPELLQETLEGFFDQLGIPCEEVSPGVFFAEPGDGMFTTFFPELPPEGLRFTYDRKRALLREDVTFVTWDHPMILGVFDAILTHEYGNTALARWSLSAQKGRADRLPQALLELTFRFTCPMAADLNGSRFFPPTPARWVITSDGRDLTREFTPEVLEAAIRPLNPKEAREVPHFPPEFLKKVSAHAERLARAAEPKLVQEGLARIRATLGGEVQRLESLRKLNPWIPAEEIEAWKSGQAKMEDAFERSRLELDSILLVY